MQGMSSVAACMVSFNPGPEAELVLRSVLPQVSTVFVVDNASNRETRLALVRLCAELGVAVVANEDNVGVAGAYNQAARMAIDRGYEWMLLIDQDSVAPAGLVEQLLRGVARWGGQRLPAVACPLSAGSEPSRHQSAVPDADMAVQTCINAGSVVRLAAWEGVGGYDESFFLDYVDHEFCFRCRQHGWEIVQVGGVTIIHSPGSPTTHRLLWKRPVTSNHSALRRYYITRNRVLFYRKYWRSDAGWVLRDGYHAIKEILMLVMFESEKREKLNAIGIGLVDGCRGVTGKTERAHFLRRRT